MFVNANRNQEQKDSRLDITELPYVSLSDL